jgi:hypothetical protein
MKKTKSRPLRRRAAAAPLHTPWIRRSPSADGKSTVLGFKKPPPCSALAIAISHHIRAIKIFNARSRHLAIFGEGRPGSTTPRSSEPKDNRTAAELHWSRTIGGGSRRHQKPLRPRRLHPSATG